MSGELASTASDDAVVVTVVDVAAALALPIAVDAVDDDV